MRLIRYHQGSRCSKDHWEFRRDNPLLINDLQTSLASQTSSHNIYYPDRTGVLQQVLNNVRHSASSATLSMLNSIKPTSTTATTTNTTFTSSSALSIPEDATFTIEEFENDSEGVELSTGILNSRASFNENLESVLEVLESADLFYGNNSMIRQNSFTQLSRLATTSASIPLVINGHRSVSVSDQRIKPTHTKNRSSTNFNDLNSGYEILEALSVPYLDVSTTIPLAQKQGSCFQSHH